MNLRNMTSSEIKTLVDSGEIKLDSLSKEELEVICDKETEALYVDESHDIKLLNTCSRLLSHFDSEEFAESWNKRYDIHDINSKLLARDESVNKTKKKHVPVRKRTIIAIAAAIFVCILSITVIVAVFDPFAKFGLSVKDLFAHRGDVITGDNYNIYISDGITYFDTFSDLSKAVNVKVFIPDENMDYQVNEISFYKFKEYNEIFIDLLLSNGSSVSYSVYYGSTAPEELDEKYYNGNPSAEKSVWRGYNVYYIEYSGTHYAYLYVDDYIYEFTADSKDSITLLLNDLK